METVEQARETIYNELTANDSDIRDKYLQIFDKDIKLFVDAMSDAFMKWVSLYAEGNKNEEKGLIATLAYVAIALHIESFKLFLSGHIIASGNIFRQVVESIALTVLCSTDPSVLVKFRKNKYKAKDAVKEILNKFSNGNRLGIKKDGVQELKKSQIFYHKYSHVSLLTIANLMPFSEEGIYLGASFDNGKIDAYRKEVNARIGLSRIFVNFICISTAVP